MQRSVDCRRIIQVLEELQVSRSKPYVAAKGVLRIHACVPLPFVSWHSGCWTDRCITNAVPPHTLMAMPSLSPTMTQVQAQLSFQHLAVGISCALVVSPNANCAHITCKTMYIVPGLLDP
jgi:hypothetical protein